MIRKIGIVSGALFGFSLSELIHQERREQEISTIKNIVHTATYRKIDSLLTAKNIEKAYLPQIRAGIWPVSMIPNQQQY